MKLSGAVLVIAAVCMQCVSCWSSLPFARVAPLSYGPRTAAIGGFRRRLFQRKARVVVARRTQTLHAAQFDEETEAYVERLEGKQPVPKIQEVLYAMSVGSPGAEHVSPEVEGGPEEEDVLEDAPSTPSSLHDDIMDKVLSQARNLSDVKVRTSYPDFGTLEFPRMSDLEIRNFLEQSVPIAAKKFSNKALEYSALYNFQTPPPKLQSFARWIVQRKKEQLTRADPPMVLPISEWPSWVYELDKPHPYLDPENGKFIAERDELPPKFQVLWDRLESTESRRIDYDPYCTMYPDIANQKLDFPVGLSYNPAVELPPGGYYNSSEGIVFYMQPLNASDPEDLKLREMRKRGDWGNLTALYEEDDRLNEHDIKFRRSMEIYVRRATPHLFDHLAAAERLIGMNTTFEDNFLDALMPFPDINYTNTLMEFQTFKQLMPQPPDPYKLFENDTFTPAEDRWTFWKYHLLRREHESWEPSDPSEHFINETVVEAIRPVLNVVGNVMKLISTKDDFFRYEYYGPIKHIIGMRAYVQYITKHVYPPCKGVRLETERDVDEEDLGHPHWMETTIWDIDKPLPGECIINPVRDRLYAEGRARAAAQAARERE